MSTPLYTLQDVRQVYHDRTVLDIPAMTIRRGEILAIVGPSGAGKSTLLRLLNFLERPSGGSLAFDGNLAGPDLPLAVRRRVTTVFQKPNLLNRSVRANVGYGLGLRGRRPQNGVVDEWLVRLGLASLHDQRARKLSAGEAQRVALARALITEPEVLLLDEPTANLDPANVALIEEIITEDNQQRGTTMVLVTHNVFQARRVAQRTALMLGGKLVEVTDTAVFFENPNDPKTAAFVRGDIIY